MARHSACSAGFAQVFSAEIALTRPRRRARRGFTLIELVVVVVVISVLAVLAIPSVTERMRERRASHAAQEISAIYRNARMRALGRGSAVLVNYTSTTGFSVREAIEGATAATTRGGSTECQVLPARGCLTNDWGPGGTFRVINQFRPESRGEFGTVQTRVSFPAGTDVEYLDVCFTPVGRSFARVANNVALTPMTGVVSVNVQRGTIGLRRTVVVLPNGTSRLAESGS